LVEDQAQELVPELALALAPKSVFGWEVVRVVV
jgi:hypothetical protein